MMGVGGRFLTAANLISITRIPLSGLACLSLVHGDTAAIAVFVALAICSDWIDGMVARATRTVSDWGKVLDPLADKLGIAAFLITLTVMGRVAPWFAAVIVLRDLAIAAAGLYMVRRLPSVPSSSIWGKLSTVLVSLHLARQALAPSAQWPGTLLPGLDLLGTSALCMAVLSLALYASRALGQLGKTTGIHRKRTTCT
jgi:CDP-diacylglycerol--glycerol-3-phosphate 3-phosphatidyltransferase